MFRSIEDGMRMEQVRLAGPEFVRSGYTWKHVVDRLLPVAFLSGRGRTR